MTTNAVIRDPQVVKDGGTPGNGCMAVVAGVAAGNVSWMLAGCRHTVVA